MKEKIILYVTEKNNIWKKYSMYIGLSIKTVPGRDNLNYYVNSYIILAAWCKC
jgi:hypothetical protein